MNQSKLKIHSPRKRCTLQRDWVISKMVFTVYTTGNPTTIHSLSHMSIQFKFARLRDYQLQPEYSEEHMLRFREILDRTNFEPPASTLRVMGLCSFWEGK